jgi:HPt (histidine-containing phosphotransfer) domain-containing protein
MDDYLAKPVTPEALAAALHRWVRRDPQAAAPPGVPEEREAAPARGVPQAPADPEAQLLAYLRSFVEQTSPSIVGELVAGFLRTAPRHLAALEQASAQGDLTGIQGAAHVLRGMSGQIGARGMSELAGRIEGLTREGTTDGIAGLLGSLNDEFARAREILEREVHRLGTEGREAG